jgi:hypothetical protein
MAVPGRGARPEAHGRVPLVTAAKTADFVKRAVFAASPAGQNACQFKVLGEDRRCSGTAEKTAVTADFGGAAGFDQQERRIGRVR